MRGKYYMSLKRNRVWWYWFNLSGTRRELVASSCEHGFVRAMYVFTIWAAIRISRMILIHAVGWKLVHLYSAWLDPHISFDCFNAMCHTAMIVLLATTLVGNLKQFFRAGLTCIASNWSWLWKTIWKRSGSKLSWHVLRYYHFPPYVLWKLTINLNEDRQLSGLEVNLVSRDC
jgi:hypothetical protein